MGKNGENLEKCFHVEIKWFSAGWVWVFSVCLLITEQWGGWNMVCTGVIKASDNLKSFWRREAASLSCSRLQLCRCHSQALVKGHGWAPARLFPTGRTCGSWSVCHRRPRPLSCCASRDRTSCLLTMKWFSLVTAALRENFSHLKLSHTLRLSLDFDFGPQARPLNFPPASLWFYLLPVCVCVCSCLYCVYVLFPRLSSFCSAMPLPICWLPVEQRLPPFLLLSLWPPPLCSLLVL